MNFVTYVVVWGEEFPETIYELYRLAKGRYIAEPKEAWRDYLYFPSIVIEKDKETWMHHLSSPYKKVPLTVIRKLIDKVKEDFEIRKFG